MKIKEGGGMDFQKEREAFECEFKQTDYYIAHGDLSTLMLCDDQYALDDVQVSFEMWQAAKAQAVPEGFVLVPLDVVDRCMSHIARAMCHQNNSNTENYIMQTDMEILESAIEAQEPAND